MKKIILVLLLALSTSAFAEGTSWTGLKLGFGFVANNTESKNVVSGSHNLVYEGDNVWEAFSGGAESSKDLGKFKGLGSVDFAYDYQLNNSLVIGLIGNYDFSSKAKSTGTETDTTNTLATGCNGSSNINYNGSCNDSTSGATSITSSVQTGNSGSLGARFGFLINESTFTYLTGGWSTINVKQNLTYQSTATIPGNSGNITFDYATSLSNSKNQDGYFIGCGLESKLNDKVSAKIEYRYSDYGKITSKGLQDAHVAGIYGDLNSGGLYGSQTSLSQESKLLQQSIRAVLSYNF